MIVARARRGRDDCANRRGYPPRKPFASKENTSAHPILCRAYTDEAVRSLAAIMRHADAPPRARIQAAVILLDRGWGKPPQPHAGEDGKDIRVTIRKIHRGR